MTAEEELEHIKVALKTALKTALIRRPAKVIERMGLLLQQLLRDKDITIVALASLLGASRRTVQEDIAKVWYNRRQGVNDGLRIIKLNFIILKSSACV